MDNYFYQSIIDNPHLVSIFKEGVENFSIQNFDSTIMSKLRKVYYSSISGILYLLGEADIPSTHGNKLQVLSAALNDEDYTIVHGQTRSSRNSTMVDTSWIEVKKNNKTWVYDVVSMLMFEKHYFELLESPTEEKRVPKSAIIAHPAYSEEAFNFEYVPMLIVWFMSRYEENKENPFYKELRAEIKRYKKDINYDKAIKDFYMERDSIEKHGI